MKKLKSLALATAVSAALFSSVGAFALPTQGTPGTTSEGEFEVAYIEGQYVRIWGLDNFIFDNTSDGASQSRNICVFSNGTNSSNQYQLTVTSGNGDAGDADEYFKMSDGSTDVNYDFVFKDNGNTDVWTTATNDSTATVSNIEAGLLADQPDPREDCSDGVNTNAAITITVPTAPTQAGFYTDTLTLLVEPQ